MNRLQNYLALPRSSAGNSGKAVGEFRRGGAAVELAVVLPLLLLVLLGATDFGRFGHTWIAVVNASRAGAGYGGMHPFSPASRPAWEMGIRQAVRYEMEGVRDFDPSRLDVTIASQTDSEGRQRVDVQVTYPFETIVNWAMIPASLPLRQNSALPIVR